jgi:hypothetical protein
MPMQKRATIILGSNKHAQQTTAEGTNTVEFGFALQKLFLNDILKGADKAQLCQEKQNWVSRFSPAV